MIEIGYGSRELVDAEVKFALLDIIGPKTDETEHYYVASWEDVVASMFRKGMAFWQIRAIVILLLDPALCEIAQEPEEVEMDGWTIEYSSLESGESLKIRFKPPKKTAFETWEKEDNEKYEKAQKASQTGTTGSPTQAAPSKRSSPPDSETKPEAQPKAGLTTGNIYSENEDGTTYSTQ